MSIRYVATVLDHVDGLTATEKLVLVALADYTSDDTRECWPSIATIARRACCDRRTAQRRLKVLEARGLIERAIGGHQYGKNSASRYRLKFDYAGHIVPDVQPVLIHKGGTMPPPRGGTSAAPGAAQRAAKGGTSAAPSVIEPSLNQRGAQSARGKESAAAAARGEAAAKAAAAMSDEELEERARAGTLTAAQEYEREHRRRMRPRRAAS